MTSFTSAPSVLFDQKDTTTHWGKFEGRVTDANILNCVGLYSDNQLNNKRLKEWQAFQLGDGNRFVCGALYNAKQFAVIAISYYDRATGQHYLYKKFVSPKDLTIANGTLPSVSFYHKSGLHFYIQRDESGENTDISVHWPRAKLGFGSSSLPALSLEARMTEKSDGMSICQPFQKGRPLYSYKNLAPAKVEVKLDSHRILQTAPFAGILDDHKGFYPRYVNYDWGTAGGYVNGKLLGFNLTRNQIKTPEKYNENCLWLDGKIYSLPAIEVNHIQKKDPSDKGCWHYKDKTGMVDLIFNQDVANTVKVNLGFKFIDYQGPYGGFTGHIFHPEVGRVEFDNMLGMAERKRYKL